MMIMEEDLFIGQKISTEFQEELINRKRKESHGGAARRQGQHLFVNDKLAVKL